MKEVSVSGTDLCKTTKTFMQICKPMVWKGTTYQIRYGCEDNIKMCDREVVHELDWVV
jgi:hypothetical protein